MTTWWNYTLIQTFCMIIWWNYAINDDNRPFAHKSYNTNSDDHEDSWSKISYKSSTPSYLLKLNLIFIQTLERLAIVLLLIICLTPNCFFSNLKKVSLSPDKATKNVVLGVHVKNDLRIGPNHLLGFNKEICLKSRFF